jgi:Protein of unknown function (DUF732)
VKRLLSEVDSGRRTARHLAEPGVARPPQTPLVERDLDMARRRSVVAGIAIASALGSAALTLAPPALAVPGPEVEYTYNVIVRRHFDFPNNDAIGYGFAICDKVSRGVGYSAVMGDVKRDVFPNDEQAANYVVSYAVGILCPAQIWPLRNSAAGYQPPPG